MIVATAVISPHFQATSGAAIRTGATCTATSCSKTRTVTDLPYEYFDEPYPEGLWARLVGECIDAGNGCDVLTIPHNSNLSDGVYFENKMANGDPLTPEYVELRNAMEPVIEIYQHKGASECIPGAATADELCGFEVIPFSNLATTNLERITPPDPKGFLRYAYGEGMRFEGSLGTNPFQYGITAATDTHISAPGFVAERRLQRSRRRRSTEPLSAAASGLPRRGVSQPRRPHRGLGTKRTRATRSFRPCAGRKRSARAARGWLVRMFGGWDYPSDLCNAPDLVAQADAAGVPMGGTLEPQPGFVRHRYSSFRPCRIRRARLFSAIQIVKGWLDGDDYQVQVFEIAGDAEQRRERRPRHLRARRARALATSAASGRTPTLIPRSGPITTPECSRTRAAAGRPGSALTAEYDCNDWDYAACVERKAEFLSQSDYTCDCCDPAAGLNPAFCAEVDCSRSRLAA